MKKLFLSFFGFLICFIWILWATKAAWGFYYNPDLDIESENNITDNFKELEKAEKIGKINTWWYKSNKWDIKIKQRIGNRNIGRRIYWLISILRIVNFLT